MNKPTKPSQSLPNSFGGVKENFSSSLISSGYQHDVPEILGGANLNYMLDTLGKKDVYQDAICDFINGIPVGKTITVNSSNQLVYGDYMPTADIEKMITDCVITNGNKVEITIEDDLITLKAGSEVYLPNGTTTAITTAVDRQLPSNQTFSPNQTYLLFGVSQDGGQTIASLRRDFVSNTGSGASVPSGFTGDFFNTTDITIKNYRSGTAESGLLTLPIAFITSDGNGNVSKIEQIQEFDMFGFIGSIVYLLPNVTYLVPNGRNDDGTLKNYKITNYALKFTQNFSTLAKNYVVIRYDADNETSSLGIITKNNLNKPNSSYYYDKEHNVYVQRSDNTQLNWCNIGLITVNTNSPYPIEKWDIKPPFRAANYYDTTDVDLSNLSDDGKALFDNKANKNLDNVMTIDSGSAVKTALDTKVNKSGDTMTGSLLITHSANDQSTTMKNTDDDISSTTGSAPSSTKMRSFRAKDKNDNIIGDIRIEHDTNDAVNTKIYARSYRSGNQVDNYFGVTVKANGTRDFIYHPDFITKLEEESELGAWSTSLPAISEYKVELTEPTTTSNTLQITPQTAGHSSGIGYVYYEAKCTTATPAQIGLQNNSKHNIKVQATSASVNGETIGVLLPVEIGDEIKVGFTTNTSSRKLYFIPSKGTVDISAPTSS